MMYDALSSDYDRFVNWNNRLPAELPFILAKLQEAGARSILDAAAGTGMHAIALAQHGYLAAGADLSSGMIDKARQNAASNGVQVRFEIAPFGALSPVFGQHNFDALLCLGNSLPHLLSFAELDSALHDFAACLGPGGLLLIQNRNFDRVMAHHERWMEPQGFSQGGTDWIFQRFYDFDSDGLLTFNMVTLKRIGQGSWTQNIVSSRLLPMMKDNLLTALTRTGFSGVFSFGSLAGESFDPETSPNLVLLARLA